MEQQSETAKIEVDKPFPQEQELNDKAGKVRVDRRMLISGRVPGAVRRQNNGREY